MLENRQPAEFAHHAGVLQLSGSWTAQGLGDIEQRLQAVEATDKGPLILDGCGVSALDSVGAWVLRRWLRSLDGAPGADWRGWSERHRKLLDFVAAAEAPEVPAAAPQTRLEAVGRRVVEGLSQSIDLLAFIGQSAMAMAAVLRHPSRWRGRAVLRGVQTAGFEALPIVGLTSFLLGIVVAYQGADQLRTYGASIFVVELVGYSMLREFAPLITAIIVAGRSGSAYAAEIGTMKVTEEIDALRTLGIEPLELLVLPKIFALLLALPLLTMAADIAGIFGGMLMASTRLGIGYAEFIDRFGSSVPLSMLVIGVGKSLLFAIVIAVVGAFQGFRTESDAGSVGRQTTVAVVQSIFLVIVCDAALSVVFSALDL